MEELGTKETGAKTRRKVNTWWYTLVTVVNNAIISHYNKDNTFNGNTHTIRSHASVTKFISK